MIPVLVTSMEPVIEDEELWHTEEGVPRLQDQFIQQYLQGRDALVEQEKQQRSGTSWPQSGFLFMIFELSDSNRSTLSCKYVTNSSRSSRSC